MSKRIPAIKTQYNGITFRSSLEAKYAQAFDKLGIIWEYEPGGFRFDDGTCYAPDFYLPETKIFFEVKGLMDDASAHKIAMLALDGHDIVVGYPDGSLRLLGPFNDRYDVYDHGTEDVRVGTCATCGKIVFWDESAGWACPSCGAYDGNPCTVGNFDDPSNMFAAVGWHYGR